MRGTAREGLEVKKAGSHGAERQSAWKVRDETMLVEAGEPGWAVQRHGRPCWRFRILSYGFNEEVTVVPIRLCNPPPL